MEMLTVYGKEYTILGENLKHVEANGLSKDYVKSRLKNGWTLHEACKAPKGKRLDDYREEQRIQHMESQVRSIRVKGKEERHREKHPWLYDGTTQLHPRSKYVADLMENDAFPKVVK